ncbi:MAG: YggS family pyridoxal phosphate-dependent enzyme [Oscillospiraceae bacterium]
MMENQLNNYISERVKYIKENINDAALVSGRNPNEISLMAVTKTRTTDEVNAAINAGVTLLGENRAQELLEKFDSYNKQCQIHFIGHLQTNKVKSIIDKVTMIHSVDSLKLAEEINKHSLKLGKIMDILIEVNIGNEITKSGVLKEQVLELLYSINNMKNINVLGLMTIPPKCDETQSEKYFSDMYKLYVDIRSKNIDNINMNVLSMGTSDDYKTAVKYGSNIVRIGKAMFAPEIIIKKVT